MADDPRESIELIEFIAKAIVTEPESLQVVAADGGRVLEMETSNNDRGRVIAMRGENFVGFQFHPESVMSKTGLSLLHEALSELVQ